MTVRRVDIEAELEAAAAGECLACRIGARHKVGSTCPGAKSLADRWCARGKHDVPTRVAGARVVREGTCTHCGAQVRG